MIQEHNNEQHTPEIKEQKTRKYLEQLQQKYAKADIRKYQIIPYEKTTPQQTEKESKRKNKTNTQKHRSKK